MAQGVAAGGGAAAGDAPDPYGLPRLREALAGHLRRSRGIPVGPENIMVTRGTGNGLDLVAAAFLRPGDRAGVEEPGYRVARNVFAARGAEIVPCPVDGDGVLVDDLPGDLRVLYTTPAHQYPSAAACPSRAASACWPGPGAPARSSWRTTTTPSSATTSPRCPPCTASTRPG
nr:hypothetical protein GCM10020093_052610 [Planobispora longispora]